ncbi:hypothetical protein Atc_1396 [Acidithiobacillus caldus SM-1]|uniref:Uncharacterized protein n=1 Tax=Acidithiobacillus caldus (strain SM-1) TaxID=990288 RepID=F9ZNP3_ACICS|nr:hypothetical protein Atc_1396 [Acidithiobacillus caldus SM-1]QER45425.1 hypothetical protein F0726_02370 [Acidithiobacillus caldus]
MRVLGTHELDQFRFCHDYGLSYERKPRLTPARCRPETGSAARN